MDGKGDAEDMKEAEVKDGTQKEKTKRRTQKGRKKTRTSAGFGIARRVALRGALLSLSHYPFFCFLPCFFFCVFFGVFLLSFLDARVSSFADGELGDVVWRTVDPTVAAVSPCRPSVFICSDSSGAFSSLSLVFAVAFLSSPFWLPSGDMLARWRHALAFWRVGWRVAGKSSQPGSDVVVDWEWYVVRWRRGVVHAFCRHWPWVRVRRPLRAAAPPPLSPSHPPLPHPNGQRPASSHSHSSRPSTQQSGFSTFSAASARARRLRARGASAPQLLLLGGEGERVVVNCNETKYTTDGNANAAYSDDGERGGRDRERESRDRGRARRTSSVIMMMGGRGREWGRRVADVCDRQLGLRRAPAERAWRSRAPPAPSHESRRRNAEQRASTLRSDALIGKVEPNRVFCKLCEKWVQLRQDSSYCAYPWLQHRASVSRGSCVWWCTDAVFAWTQSTADRKEAAIARCARGATRARAMDVGMGQEFDELVSDAMGCRRRWGGRRGRDVAASVMMGISATRGRQDGHGRDGEGEEMTWTWRARRASRER
ncbi:Stalk rot protein [Salix suchowensis]|nr:Stalk rot protein [Salix suchowensis]